MKSISKHISFNEAVKSNTASRLGIKNTPNIDQKLAMEYVAHNCFEPLREFFGKPIGISSFFRSPELNTRIGGSKTSHHCLGAAIDIDFDIFDNGMTNLDAFNWLRVNASFEQLIGEYPKKDGNYSWIHISLLASHDPKNQILIAEKIGGKTKYRTFIDGI